MFVLAKMSSKILVFPKGLCEKFVRQEKMREAVRKISCFKKIYFRENRNIAKMKVLIFGEKEYFGKISNFSRKRKKAFSFQP
jgi:hypothetical protein